MSFTTIIRPRARVRAEAARSPAAASRPTGTLHLKALATDLPTGPAAATTALWG